MIDEKIAPAVSELYQWGVAVWQDNYGKESTDHKKHSMVIRHRIPYEHQAPKMADVWLIENVWTIIKQNLDGQDFKNIQELRAEIRASWRRTSQNQKLGTQLIGSLPKRLEAVIKNKGNQVTK